MTTVRQIEKLWRAKSYGRLCRELISNRAEAQFDIRPDASFTAAAAALAIIRLSELNQPHASIYAELIRVLVRMQDRDGGWGEPMLTALCIRALQSGDGQGESVERGLMYLANLQKENGLWPRIPIRRMDADPAASAFILFQLGDNGAFRGSIRLGDAVGWFEQNEPILDAAIRRLWHHAALRCRTRAAHGLAMASWS